MIACASGFRSGAGLAATLLGAIALAPTGAADGFAGVNVRE